MSASRVSQTGHASAFSGSLAFVVTIVAAFASAMPGLLSDGVSSGTLLLLLALGLAYILVGTFGDGLCLSRPSVWPRLAYFAVQLLLAGIILYLSGASGFMALIIFPLISQAQTALQRGLALLVGALSVLTFSIVVYRLAGLGPTLNSMPVIIAGLVFVAVFTQVAMRESQARAEVERLAAELGAANQKLREAAGQVEELATARERNRLARDIHDSLGHYLTVINVQLEAAQVVAESDPARARAALGKARSLAQEGLADVRRSVAALRAAPAAGRPLPEAMAELAHEAQAGGILTSLDVLGSARAIAPQAELTLYRAAQEALTNVRKHARATRADLTLDYNQAGRVRLVVQDNGVGASSNGLAALENNLGASEDGFGLLGLRERAQLVGGSVSLHSAPGEGFRLEVETPG